MFNHICISLDKLNTQLICKLVNIRRIPENRAKQDKCFLCQKTTFATTDTVSVIKVKRGRFWELIRRAPDMRNTHKHSLIGKEGMQTGYKSLANRSLVSSCAAVTIFGVAWHFSRLDRAIWIFIAGVTVIYWQTFVIWAAGFSSSTVLDSVSRPATTHICTYVKYLLIMPHLDNNVLLTSKTF